MKNQALFSSRDKSKKLKCHLLQFLFGALGVKDTEPVLQIRRGKKDNLGIIFLNSPLKHVVTHHQNRLTETVLMRGHNICFCLEKKKNYL